MIITSLLDTDLYKFTMMQVVLHQFPGAQVEYRFKCRNPGVQLAPYVNEIREEIRSLCKLRFQDAELAYLSSLRFIKSDFVDFLSLFQLNDKYITVTPLASGEIDITIQGPWLHTILFEIPVLAIVNEVYFRNTQPVPNFLEGRKRLDEKIELLQAPVWSRSRSPTTAPAGAFPGPGMKRCCGCSAPGWVTRGQHASTASARGSWRVPAMCCMQ